MERFFKTLEIGGFHRLPGTTGSNIKDNKRRNPEGESIKYQIRYNDICELVEYLIVTYNNSAHSSLENQTPLQVMERRIRHAGMQPYVISPSERPYIDKLTYFTEEKTLRGGYSSGTKPYISYLSTKYHAVDIQIPMNLIGQKVYIEVNPSNVRHVDLYGKDGKFIAKLVATGEWGRRDHSLKTHLAALKREKMNLQTNTLFTPNLSEYEEGLRESAKKSRRDRTNAAIVEKEMGKKAETPLASELVNDSSPKALNKTRTYTKEEIDLIDSMSIEEAYKRGLI